MKTMRLAVAAAVLVMAGGSLDAQEQGIQTGQAFDNARLEQLVAPIALYPDSLLMQVLMASTYPLEIVEADRLVRANPGLSAEALQSSLATQNWDPSVKVLAGFPDVLKTSSENLDWTRDLGDAFLSQRSALLDVVQKMRARAREAGTLVSTSQQTVTVLADGIIVIESASPATVYVPTYSPLGVYGGWSHRRYHYPRLYRSGYWPGSGLSFSSGFGWGGWFWGTPQWGWGRSNVFIDVNRFNRFSQFAGGRTNPTVLGRADPRGAVVWQHQPEHRLGVRYPDSATARQFGVSRETLRVPRDEARGFQRTKTPVSPPATVRRSDVPRTIGVPDAARRIEPRSAPRAPAAQPPSKAFGRPNVGIQPKGRSSSAWSGSRNPGSDRQSGARGTRSTGSRSRAGPPAGKPKGRNQ